MAVRGVRGATTVRANDPQAIFDRVRQVGALGAVSQRGVVELDSRATRRIGHADAPSTTRSPTSDVE